MRCLEGFIFAMTDPFLQLHFRQNPHLQQGRSTTVRSGPALSGRARTAVQCLLSGEEQAPQIGAVASTYDPERRIYCGNAGDCSQKGRLYRKSCTKPLCGMEHYFRRS
jgi:hypothetical protein